MYYFHTDQVGLPEELSNAQGQIIWQAQYKTWGSTVEERWEARRLHGAKVQGQTQGDTPEGDRQEQNLRFQGQYLDRETGLHYNTFRYYDADIGRFISPDPIGLDGGINLGSYSPNPVSWIDPWGWACGKTGDGRAGKQARLRELANDPKLDRADRGWIKQDINSINQGKRTNIRNPPGKDLAHERGREAAKGYSYKYAHLQDRKTHRTQHKYDNYGRKNKERPVLDD